MQTLRVTHSHFAICGFKKSRMGVYSILFLAAGLFVGALAIDCNKNLLPDLSYKLSGTELAFPCKSTENIYKQTGRYIPKNVIATRLQVYQDNAIVALPRYKHGVPYTLAKFSLKSKGCKAILEPFPCWSIQEEGNCEALQNVIDIVLDPNDILWVLDLGICNTLEQPIRRCPPKIVAINAATGIVVKVVDLSPFILPESRPQYILVDYAPDGTAFVYVSDAGTGSILVYNVSLAKVFRVVLPAAAVPESKDVLYIALARKSCGNVIYLTYLSSPKLFSIRTELIYQGQANGCVVEAGVNPPGTKIVMLGTDNGAAIFFRYKGESDIFIWNSETTFKPENFLLVQKGGDCRLSTQVVPGYKRLMWALESNFYDYIANTVGCLGASMYVQPLIKTCE
ncbi:major royal jelly protein 1-like [Harmonia axyridis]|uniref:major royal jelly protein 1-like n=1 Tax=Harmonia axyridis TaxID=115357 RepID=UPI001E276A3C|nr:major royal jelly protein 1-like [Harmonia axyridis]